MGAVDTAMATLFSDPDVRTLNGGYPASRFDILGGTNVSLGARRRQVQPGTEPKPGGPISAFSL